MLYNWNLNILYSPCFHCDVTYSISLYTDIHSSSPMFSWHIKVSIRWCTLRNPSRSNCSPVFFPSHMFCEFWEFGHTTLFIYRFLTALSRMLLCLFKNPYQPDIATDSTMVWVWGGAMYLSDQWQKVVGELFRRNILEIIYGETRDYTLHLKRDKTSENTLLGYKYLILCMQIK